MKSFHFVSQLSDPKNRTYFFSLFIAASLICGVYFVGSALVANDYRIELECFVCNVHSLIQKFVIIHIQRQMPQRSEMEVNITTHETLSDKCKMPQRSEMEVNVTQESAVNVTEHRTQSDKCTNRCRPPGSEAWPEGMTVPTSDLRMRPLWGSLNDDIKAKPPVSLLAIAAGIKQKDLVNKIVTKFLGCNFSVMIFHYDGVVDQWKDLGWNSHVIHVSAVNQTKWWFAKRFLHPDIVAEYEYIFLWDEDLGVDNFHPGRYVSIVKEEELEVSQPALDPAKSEVHHQITVRRKHSKVHRSYIKLRGGGKCFANSTGPPCFGWVEIMAPVFSKAAWRCMWYLIQNDLIHAWGIDFQLGYCAKGDRKKHVGVVDAEYIVHLGVPTLGGSGEAKPWNASNAQHSQTKKSTDLDDAEPTPLESSHYHLGDSRSEVRRQSYIELRIFWHRWWRAIEDDKCWVDPYKQKESETKKKCLVHPCDPSKGA